MVRTIVVVKFLRAIDTDAEQELVFMEELAPFVIK